MKDEEPLEDMGNPEIPSSMRKYPPVSEWLKGQTHIYPRLLPFIPVVARDDKMSQKQREHLSKYVIDQNLVKPHIATIQTTIKSSEPDCWVIGGLSSSPPLSLNETSKKYSASAWRSLLGQTLSSLSTTK